MRRAGRKPDRIRAHWLTHNPDYSPRCAERVWSALKWAEELAAYNERIAEREGHPTPRGYADEYRDALLARMRPNGSYSVAGLERDLREAAVSALLRLRAECDR